MYMVFVRKLNFSFVDNCSCDNLGRGRALIKELLMTKVTCALSSEHPPFYHVAIEDQQFLHVNHANWNAE